MRAWRDDLRQDALTQLRDFLNRFKPATAPGSAALAAVPGDRAAWLAAEIDPVLGMLADTHERCAAIAAEGEQEAARIARGAAESAALIAAEGVSRAASARDAAAREAVAAGRARADAILSAATEAARSRGMPDEADVITLIRLAVRLVQAADGVAGHA